MGLAAGQVGQLDHLGDWGLLATDADLVVTGWNRWLEQRSGRAAETVLGQSLLTLFPELQARGLERYYHQALGGQTAILSQRFHKYVIPLPPAAGSPEPARMQQAVRIVPVVEGSDVRGTLTVIEDVTERVAYEAELRTRARQQTALATLARSALTGRGVPDLAREVVGLVRETLGVDFAEVLELAPDGRSWLTLAGSGWATPPAPATDLDAAPRTLHVLKSEAAAAVEDVAADPHLNTDPFLQRHGAASGLAVRVSLPGPGQPPFGMLGLYTRVGRRFAAADVQFAQAVADVLGVATDRRRLEAELRLRAQELAEADRRKDEFLATLAHELRNPLAPVRNWLQVIRHAAGGDADTVRRSCEVMDRQIGQMVRLIDDLLDISRITRGKVELRRERVGLAEVVTAAVETSRPLVDAAGHQLTVTLPPDRLPLDADPTRLAQVLSNLLNNAAKYSERGGHIWLEAERDGTEAVVRVRDTGVGIPADMLPRVFEMFTQVERSVARAQGGLGIGLTLVRSLVDLHGGSVHAASDGPGLGSEFTVRLPLARAADASGGRIAESPSALRTPTARRILVVDDNVDSAESLSLLLQLSGHEVRFAHDGPAALDAARGFRPEVVLLDIGMPGMSGYEVARALREQPESRDAVLIAMTGWGQPEDRRRTHEAGFDHHLVKPVDLDALGRLLGTVTQ